MNTFAALVLISALVLQTDARPSNKGSFGEVLFRETRDKSANTIASPAKPPVLKIRFAPAAALALPVGSNHALECEAGGNPVPTIHWLKNGQRIFQTAEERLRLEEEVSPQGILGLGFTRSRLFIDCFQPQDEGSYTCVAENSFERQSSSSQIEVAQSAESLIASNEIALCTSKKSSSYGTGARINMWTKTRLELIGSEVRLFCRTQGFPKPSITWFTPEGRAIAHTGRMSVTDSGDLIIRNLNWGDMGAYQCVAKNEDGEDQSSTFLYPVMPEKS